MKTICLLTLMFMLQLSVLTAQKYYSKAGQIHFLSEASLERIEANNKSALVVFDAANGQMEWSVLIKGFQFEKAMMQEHFNENYMESHKFPKGLFKGALLNTHEIEMDKDGTYPVAVKGALTIHGVTQSVTIAGQMQIHKGAISVNSVFEIAIADYGIVVPKIVRDNVAKTVKVDVTADLVLMN
jgi:polyisoprenoid-binding protein YceI